MAAASPNAGLIYICNPNNPTGTITPRADIDWLVENKPKGSVILLDEAYIHLSEEPMCSDLVAKDKDVVILRTFSKIYGMAGIRAGAAFGRPDLLQKVGQYSAGALPVTAMVGSHRQPEIEERRARPPQAHPGRSRRRVRVHGQAQIQLCPLRLEQVHGGCASPRQPDPDRHEAEKVYIGRVWPSWPTHVRVTIGTQDEMDKFKAAFLKVMA